MIWFGPTVPIVSGGQRVESLPYDPAVKLSPMVVGIAYAAVVVKEIAIARITARMIDVAVCADSDMGIMLRFLCGSFRVLC